MKLGFTGTREGMTIRQKYTVRFMLEVTHPHEVHHGDCLGSDAECNVIAVNLDLFVVTHPPLLNTYRAFTKHKLGVDYAPADYKVRDRAIVNETDFLLATPNVAWQKGSMWYDRGRGGTLYTVKYAIERGVNTMVVWTDGSTSVSSRGRKLNYHG
jgi:hypothetical protein